MEARDLVLCCMPGLSIPSLMLSFSLPPQSVLGGGAGGEGGGREAARAPQAGASEKKKPSVQWTARPPSARAPTRDKNKSKHTKHFSSRDIMSSRTSKAKANDAPDDMCEFEAAACAVQATSLIGKLCGICKHVDPTTMAMVHSDLATEYAFDEQHIGKDGVVFFAKASTVAGFFVKYDEDALKYHQCGELDSLIANSQYKDVFQVDTVPNVEWKRNHYSVHDGVRYVAMEAYPIRQFEEHAAKFANNMLNVVQGLHANDSLQLSCGELAENIYKPLKESFVPLTGKKRTRHDAMEDGQNEEGDGEEEEEDEDDEDYDGRDDQDEEEADEEDEDSGDGEESDKEESEESGEDEEEEDEEEEDEEVIQSDDEEEEDIHFGSPSRNRM